MATKLKVLLVVVLLLLGACDSSSKTSEPNLNSKEQTILENVSKETDCAKITEVTFYLRGAVPTGDYSLITKDGSISDEDMKTFGPILYTRLLTRFDELKCGDSK